MSFSIRGLAALLVSAVAASAQAATFTVTSTADSGNGSLREAITVMNQTAGDTHSVVFDLPPQSTIALASDLPSIGKPFVEILGPGSGDLAIDGDWQFRQIRVAATNRSFSLSGVTLRFGGGAGQGGCLLADAPLSGGNISIQHVSFSLCRARSASGFSRLRGGAIAASERHLVLTETFMFGNSFLSSAQGSEALGGSSIALEGSASRLFLMTNSRVLNSFTSSVAQASVSSGAIEVLGGMRTTILDSRFIENEGGSAPGAALFVEGSTLIENSLFSRNGAINGQGRSLIEARAAFPGISLRIRNSTFYRNDAGLDALIAAEIDQVELRNVTFEGTRSERTAGTELRVEPRPGGAAAELRISHTVFARGPVSRSNCSAAAGVTVERRFALSDRDAPGCGLPRTSADLGLFETLDGNVLPLAAGGAAVDAGSELSPDLADWQRCMPTDARGVSRPQGGFCDLGAYEFFEAAIFANGFE